MELASARETRALFQFWRALFAVLITLRMRLGILEPCPNSRFACVRLLYLRHVLVSSPCIMYHNFGRRPWYPYTRHNKAKTSSTYCTTLSSAMVRDDVDIETLLETVEQMQ